MPDDLMKEIVSVNTETMSTQSLLVGLMLALKSAGLGVQVETAFAFADDLATASAYKFGSSGVIDTTRLGQINEKLRAVVFGPQGSKPVV